MLLLLGLRQDAEACSPQLEPICDAFTRSELVFVGTPTRIVRGGKVTRVTFRVTERIRGTAAAQLTAEIDAQCGPGVTLDEPFLVFIEKRDGGVLRVPHWAPTKEVRYVKRELAFVREAAKRPPTCAPKRKAPSRRSTPVD